MSRGGLRVEGAAGEPDIAGVGSFDVVPKAYGTEVGIGEHLVDVVEGAGWDTLFLGLEPEFLSGVTETPVQYAGFKVFEGVSLSFGVVNVDAEGVGESGEHGSDGPHLDVSVPGWTLAGVEVWAEPKGIFAGVLVGEDPVGASIDAAGLGLEDGDVNVVSASGGSCAVNGCYRGSGGNGPCLVEADTTAELKGFTFREAVGVHHAAHAVASDFIKGIVPIRAGLSKIGDGDYQQVRVDAGEGIGGEAESG